MVKWKDYFTGAAEFELRVLYYFRHSTSALFSG